MNTNPYRAPTSESLDAPVSPEPADLIPERLEFRAEVTRDHHHRAVTEAGIRKEFHSVTRAMLALGGVFVFFSCVLLLVSDDFLSATGLLRTATACTLFLGGIAIFCTNHRWLLGTQIPSYQLIVGPVQGWIDREGIWITSENHRAFSPLSALVSTSTSADLWVLSFVKDLTFWHVIPFDGFTNPSQARAVADDLGRIRPPRPAELVDDRKRQVPRDDFRFQPGSGAAHFQGSFHEDAAAGTQLVQATKQITRRTWLSLAVLLGSILASLLVLSGFQALYVSLAGIWFLFLIGNLYFRVWRARRQANQGGRVVAWYAKGWVDDRGYCAMTALGQAQSDWTLFDHGEITDEAICLYPHASDACCCLISREQFEEDGDWDHAVDLVQRKLSGRLART